MKAFVLLALVAVATAQTVEQRTIKNPDGSTTHVQSYSHSSFNEETSGPDGTVIGRTIFKDNSGNWGNQYKLDKNGKVIENNPLSSGQADQLQSRSKVAGETFVNPRTSIPAFEIPDISKMINSFNSDLARRLFTPPTGAGAGAGVGYGSVSGSGPGVGAAGVGAGSGTGFVDSKTSGSDPVGGRSSYHSSSSYSHSSNTGNNNAHIESRSSVGGNGFSRATYREESIGPDGIITGRSVFRDNNGQTYGNQYKLDHSGKVLENTPLGQQEANDMITARTKVIPGFNGPVGQLPSFQVPDFSQFFGPKSAFGSPFFGSGSYGSDFGSGFGSGFGPNFGGSFGSGFGSGFGGGYPGGSNRQSYSSQSSYSTNSKY